MKRRLFSAVHFGYPRLLCVPFRLPLNPFASQTEIFPWRAVELAMAKKKPKRCLFTINPNPFVSSAHGATMFDRRNARRHLNLLSNASQPFRRLISPAEPARNVYQHFEKQLSARNRSLEMCRWNLLHEIKWPEFAIDCSSPHTANCLSCNFAMHFARARAELKWNIWDKVESIRWGVGQRGVLCFEDSEVFFVSWELMSYSSSDISLENMKTFQMEENT